MTAPLRSGRGDEPYTTIDDLKTQAQQLLIGLERLSGYRYPLGVRRGAALTGKGVVSVHDDAMSKQLNGSGRTYFFDVKQSAKGARYLKISESRKGKDGRWERNTIFVFPEDARTFSESANEMLGKLG